MRFSCLHLPISYDILFQQLITSYRIADIVVVGPEGVPPSTKADIERRGISMVSLQWLYDAVWQWAWPDPSADKRYDPSYVDPDAPRVPEKVKEKKQKKDKTEKKKAKAKKETKDEEAEDVAMAEDEENGDDEEEEEKDE